MTQDKTISIKGVLENLYKQGYIDGQEHRVMAGNDFPYVIDQAEKEITDIMAKDKAELVAACKMAKNQLLNCAYAFDMPNRFRESFNQGQKQLTQAISTTEKGER